jgi:hypothetical protein
MHQRGGGQPIRVNFGDFGFGGFGFDFGEMFGQPQEPQRRRQGGGGGGGGGGSFL